MTAMPPGRSQTRRNHSSSSPDIITVTDCIATLSRANKLREMDLVFQEAVERGIVLGNTMDLAWEVDFSKLPLPVARAACRYLMHKLLYKRPKEISDMCFITGVGKAQQLRKDTSSLHRSKTSSNVLEMKDPTTSLRDFIQGVLETDFTPSLSSIIPKRAKGTVVVERQELENWLMQQE